ncbi:MAG: cytidylate kinase-like family protein [Anaerolineae bacterium]
MTVITISRESGAKGSYLGRQLAERLGYLYVDREMIHEVSLEYGVRQDEFERIYEHAPGVLERYGRRNREIVQLISRLIQGLARRDKMVIVARDAFAALRDYQDVLHVRVTARHKDRIRRIQQEQSLTLEQARAVLNRLDSERSKYVGAYYGLDWADSGLYDLCVNTSALNPDDAVELTLQALSFRQKNQDPKGPWVRDIAGDPILDRAIDEALSLLEATGHSVVSNQ